MNLEPKKKASPATRVGARQIHLLERLCNACGVSGDEGPVRKIVLEEIRPHVDELKVDSLGNVLVLHRGRQNNDLRVMIAAHMDEVGMMITNDEGEGIFRFSAVGGVDTRKLAGKSVLIGRSRLPGVIGVKPLHLSSMNELRHPISQDELRIDVSPACARDIRVGDWATFATTFSQIGPSIRAKALDNRLGVASLIELVKNPPENIDLLAAFTVQEEVGLRGAGTAGYALNPDLAIVLDCTPANDLPAYHGGDFLASDWENTHYNTKLGGGPAIYLADHATISDPRLIRFIVQTGEELGIPYQLRQPGGDGTDAGAIHIQRSGIPSVSISVPGRYLHTAAMIARMTDWKNTLELVFQALLRLTPEVLSAER
jgi:endoglucanase